VAPNLCGIACYCTQITIILRWDIQTKDHKYKSEYTLDHSRFVISIMFFGSSIYYFSSYIGGFPFSEWLAEYLSTPPPFSFERKMKCTICRDQEPGSWVGIIQGDYIDPSLADLDSNGVKQNAPINCSPCDYLNKEFIFSKKRRRNQSVCRCRVWWKKLLCNWRLRMQTLQRDAPCLELTPVYIFGYKESRNNEI